MDTKSTADFVLRTERQCVSSELHMHEGRVATLAYKLAIAQQEREQCLARLEAMNQIGELSEDAAEPYDSDWATLVESRPLQCG